DNQEIRRLTAPSRVEWPHFSPDGRFLVARAAHVNHPRIWLWDLDGDSARPSPAWEATKGGGVTDLAFTPDGRQIVSVLQDGEATLSTSATGEALKQLGITVQSDGGSGLAFHPDGRQLAAVGTAGKSLLIVDVETGKTVRTLEPESPLYRLAW